MQFSSQKIRQDFIDFFLEKEHKIIRSSPVFPLDDPTLLFINAGMNQFKSIFLGKEEAKFKRVVNSQKWNSGFYFITIYSKKRMERCN